MSMNVFNFFSKSDPDSQSILKLVQEFKTVLFIKESIFIYVTNRI